MLAYDLVMENRGNMFVWTLITLRTTTMAVVELTDWAIRVEAEVELRSKERFESELVLY
jgi:hypothetical protein